MNPGTYANPGTTYGHGPYGSVPGPIAIPANLYSQVNGTVPGFSNLTPQASGVINSELGGVLSPGTQNLLQDKSAALGVTGGVPGSGLQLTNLLQSLGLTSENLAHQGLGDYSNFLGSLAPTMTDPNLAASVEQQNSLNAAAPDPAAAAQQQLYEFQQYMNKLNNPAGGSSSFDGAYGPGSGVNVSEHYAGTSPTDQFPVPSA